MVDAGMQNDKLHPGILHAIGLVVAVFILQVVLVIPLLVVQAILKIDIVSHPAVVGILNILAIGAVLVWGLRINKMSTRQLFLLRPVPTPLLVPMIITSLGMAILLSETDNLFRFVLPMPEFVADVFQKLFTGQTSFWGSLMAMVVVAPLTEELLFRGLILRGFLSRYTVVKSVLVSSLLFAAMHANPWQFISAMTLGCLFAWWFLRTGSLVPCIIGHMLNNGFSLMVSRSSVVIPGFSSQDPGAAAELQPWWLDLTGVTLTLLGIWLFRRIAPRSQPSAEMEIPPIIPGANP